MAKAQFFVDRAVASGNLWNASFVTLTPSSEVSALPGANSQNPERATVWRSVTGTGEASIDLDLGAGYASYPVTGAALANVKLIGAHADRAVKLQTRGNGGSPGAATDVGTFDTQDATNLIAYLNFVPTSARHWRLLWSNADSESDYAELGYAFLGSYFEPTINFSVPSDFPYDTYSTVRRSDGGQKSVTARATYAEAALSFMELPAADFNALRAIYALVGTAKPFFIVLDQTRDWLNYFAHFTRIAQSVGRSAERQTFNCVCEEWL